MIVDKETFHCPTDEQALAAMSLLVKWQGDKYPILRDALAEAYHDVVYKLHQEL